ncbi:MAG: hypothetical protein ACI92E_000031 [Oceanicoccus sp.]|jgi:hypothetical protein
MLATSIIVRLRTRTGISPVMKKGPFALMFFQCAYCFFHLLAGVVIEWEGSNISNLGELDRLPLPLAKIFKKMLEIDSQYRFKTSTEVRHALKEVSDSEKTAII